MVRIIGHRGAAKLWAENSLHGFRKTANLGIDGVEFDVHRSADGQLVVIHDAKVDRTTFGTGPVADMTLREIRASKLKSMVPQTVPTLQDVLAIYAPTAMELQIEIKTDVFGRPYPGIADQIVKLVRDFGVEDRCTLTSFVPQILLDAYASYPNLGYLASINHGSAQQMGGLESALSIFGVIPQCIMAIHKDLLVNTLEQSIGIVGSERIGVWVPNSMEDLGHWMHLPIRQVTTDNPDIALSCRRTGSTR